MQNLNYITTFSQSLLLNLHKISSKKMVYSKGFVLILAICIAFPTLNASEPPLTLDYYKSTCPTVLEIVRKEMECAVLSDPRNAALILRLHFHDCFVQVIIQSFLIVFS